MGQEIDVVTGDGEVVTGLPMVSGGLPGADSALAVRLAHVEIDHQIATARAMPRSITRAVANIMTLATLDEETAKESMYALPRGGKPIVGPSARFAEIVFSQWGNARLAVRVTDVDRVEKFVEAEAVFHDLETNAIRTARVRRRISEKNGRIYNDDMILVTGNAAASIAARNAVLAGVPKAVWRKAYAAVEQVLRGDVKTLGERRGAAMKAFAAFGVKPEQVFAALDVKGIEDITIDHLVTLTSMHSALKNGEAEVEDMFPRDGAAAGDQPKRLAGKLDELGASGKASGKTADKVSAENGDDKASEKAADPKPKASEKAAAKSAAAEAKPVEKAEAKATPAADPAPATEKPAAAAEKAEDARSDPGPADDPPDDDRAPPPTEREEAGRHDPDPRMEDPADDGGDDDVEERVSMILANLPFTPRSFDKTSEAEALAYVAGAEAAEKGFAAKAIPTELKAATRVAEANAWRLGHAHQTEHEKASGGE